MIDQATRKNRRADVDQAYRDVFGSVPGQRVMADLMAKAGVLASSFQPADGDPYWTAFNEGRRDLFVYILKKVNPEPPAEELASMHYEGKLNDDDRSF